LKGAVNRYAVKFFSRPALDIRVRKRPLLVQEKSEDLFPAIGHAEMILL
jgi:hypothetical protein